MREFAHEFVDEFFVNFVHEFKYEIRRNSLEFVRIRMIFLREKLVMLRMACTVKLVGVLVENFHGEPWNIPVNFSLTTFLPLKDIKI